MTKPLPNRTERAAGGESGQAAVLIALLLVALLAMAGLATDGGGYLFLARDAQNAADASVLAAAFALCTNGDPEAQGMNTADDNNFEDGDGSVRVTVTVDPTDDSGALLYAPSTALSEVVEVVIEADKESYFIGIVYGDDLPVRAVAVAECVRPVAPAPSGGGGTTGYAMRSLSNAGECSSANPSVSLNGSGYRIEGDIYAGNIRGNTETGTNALKIFGDIMVGATFESGLNRDLAGDPNRSLNEQDDEIVDGVVVTEGGTMGPVYEPEFDVEPPFSGSGLPYTMDDYRPAGSDKCSPGSTRCGLVQAAVTTAYYDISSYCRSGFIRDAELQDAGLFNATTGVIASGVYYADCNIEFGNADYRNAPGGGVTFVTEGWLSTNARAFNFEAFKRDGVTHPLALSNHGTPSDCSGGAHTAIRINGNNADWTGDVVAWNGRVDFDGNNNDYQICAIAQGFLVNGGSGTRIACSVSASAEPADELPNVKMR